MTTTGFRVLGRIRSLRWMDLHDRLRAVVATRAVPLGLGPQTPVLEGRPEKTVFGGEWTPFEPGFTVRKNDAGELTIDGGAVHGLDAGAVIAIYPPDTRAFDAAGPGAAAVIASATPATSTVRLADPAVSIADRSRARSGCSWCRDCDRRCRAAGSANPGETRNRLCRPAPSSGAG